MTRQSRRSVGEEIETKKMKKRKKRHLAIAYRPDGAAAVTNLSRSEIYKRMASGDIPAHKAGAATLLLHDDLVRFIQNMPLVAAREPAFPQPQEDEENDD